jgi:hypothetical protein
VKPDINASPIARIRTLLRRHLREKNTDLFGRKLLADLLQVVFHASLRHEEGRLVACTLSVVDASNPGGKLPQLVRPQRATFVPFDEAIEFNIRNLVKIAHALPPWASSLAVCEKIGIWWVIGMFDQEFHYRNSLNQEDGDRFERAGYFQIEVTDIGAFSIYDGSLLIGRYGQGTVVRHFYDVLNRGPIAAILREYSSRTRGKAVAKRELEVGTTPETFEGSAHSIWVRTLSRVLLHIRRSNHGGALLLVPKLETAGLNIKYGLRYSKLDEVISTHIASESLEVDADDMIWEETKEWESENLPTFMYVQKTFAADDLQDSIKAEIGCINSIASLARVDGLVLLVRGFTVRGFGVEITVNREPKRVFTAGDVKGSLKKRKNLKLSDFGTRHRSMMRYCSANPGSVGFVVSQDGDVRAMTRIKNDLILWENIKLQDVRMIHRGKRLLQRPTPLTKVKQATA